MKFGITLLVLLGVGVGIWLLIRQPASVPAVNNSPIAQAELIGVSLSPKSFSEVDFPEFWDRFPSAGNTITWTGDVFDLTKKNGAPRVVQTLAQEHNLTPMMIVHLGTEDVQSAERRAAAQSAMEGFVREFKPQWIGVGNEINFAYRDTPEAFTAFQDWFSEVVKAVHTESPNTKVFTVWQLEWLMGLHGGLYGGQNNTELLAQWTYLTLFPAADGFAFTTYPGLIYATPAEIPATHYADIRTHTDKPMAFSEAGWFRTGPKGWASSSTEQAEFLRRWLAMTDALDPTFRIWTFLYDQGTVPEPATTMGLLAPDRTTSVAWEAWTEEVSTRAVQQ